MDVVRDVLDKSVVDRNGREMGRVDAIVLALESGQAPRLEAILIGPAALGSRLHPGLGRLVSACERFFRVDQDRPARINFADVADFGRNIRLRLTIGETAVDAIEQRLRAWVSRLPGSQ
jgi:sporulation protein YlmC with PRC-barrel domain